MDIDSLDEIPLLKHDSSFGLSHIISEEFDLANMNPHVYFQVLNHEINIPDAISNEFHNCCESLHREACLRCRAAHIQALSTHDIIPPWILGIGTLPAWMPHSAPC